MPVGIYKHKLSQGFQKGYIPWNKDKKCHNRKSPPLFSKKHRENISNALKGKPKSREHIRNLKIVLSKKETRKKMGESRKGAKNWNWKGGITPENEKIRKSIEYRFWIEANMARDNFTCQKTGIRGGRLAIHHINNFADYPELRFAIDNGITLSKESHEQFHKKYGIKNNTREQVEEFLNVKIN